MWKPCRYVNNSALSELFYFGSPVTFVSMTPLPVFIPINNCPRFLLDSTVNRKAPCHRDLICVLKHSTLCKTLFRPSFAYAKYREVPKALNDNLVCGIYQS